MEQWNALKKERARESRRRAGHESTTQNSKRKNGPLQVSLGPALLGPAPLLIACACYSSTIRYYTTLRCNILDGIKSHISQLLVPRSSRNFM